MRAFNRLRPLCERRLKGIPVPAPFDLDRFAATLARRRDRRLDVVRLPGLDSADLLSGAWVATDDTDYIVVNADASPWHRKLIGAHEISHMLCGHYCGPRWSPEVGTLLRTRDGTAARLLAPCAYTRPEEREAELMAHLILERSGPVPAGEDDAIAARLLQTLRHPLGHG